MEINDFGGKNLDESLFLLSHYAGWFLILKELFVGGVDCNFLHVLILVHLEIPITLDFEVSEKYACKEDIYFNLMCCTHRPPLWSSGQSSWLQTQRFRVRFPSLPNFLSSTGSGTGSIQPREDI
jgi:hypothetical protein